MSATARRRPTRMATAGLGGVLLLTGCGTGDAVGADTMAVAGDTGAATSPLAPAAPPQAHAGVEVGSDQLPGPLTASAFGVGSTATAPVAHLAGPVTGAADVAVAFDAAGSYSPLGLPVTFSWDFDDDGSWDLTSDRGDVNYRYGRTYAGLVRVQVSDNASGRKVASTHVTVTLDGDTVDAGDNCPEEFNDDQGDADGDGLGDACDATPGFEQRNGTLDDGD